MNELIQTLNATDGSRLFWYGVFVVVILGIIVDGAVSAYKIHQKNKSRDQI